MSLTTGTARAASLALIATALLPALDPELKINPMVLGATPVPEMSPYEIGARAELKSKQIAHGMTVHDDAVAAAGGNARAYGLGIDLELDFALGQAQAPARPAGAKTSPGELIQVDITIDYVAEIRSPAHPNIPLLQLRPFFHFQTYPAQPRNDLKLYQRWVGGEAWYALPVEGVEIGTSLAGNLWRDNRYVDWAIGSRQFVQSDPWDLAFWQQVNYYNKAFKNDLLGRNEGGLGQFEAGARVTLPLPWVATWFYLQTKAQYWLEKKDRDQLRTGGQDSGNFETVIGMEWKPE